MSGVGAIVSSLLTRKKLEHLEVAKEPNMPFLYLLAVLGAMLKPKWTASKKWPSLKVSLTTPRAADPARLSAFRKLTASPAAAAAGAPPPSMFLMAEGFRLVMAVLTLPAFPVSILGTVVNKRARYSLLRDVAAGERLLYSARLSPAVRETFSGHAEFDIVLEAGSAERGDAVWQAVLTLVLMNPRKGKGHGGGGGKKEPEAEAAAQLDVIDTWALAEDTGRRYAALDGDISPMHLYGFTAKLMGFPAPVANVHLLGARTEASLAAKMGAAAVSAPFSLEVEYKKPTLLPNKLTLSGPAGQAWAAAAAVGDRGGGGFQLRVDDKKGKPILVGAARKAAERV